jgi:hypothetical protein
LLAAYGSGIAACWNPIVYLMNGSQIFRSSSVRSSIHAAFRPLIPNGGRRRNSVRAPIGGGEVAAAILTGHLKPATYTLYLGAQAGPETIPALVKEHRLRADPRGNVEILDAFWNVEIETARPDIVPPVLVYADLMATLDPRNLALAKRVRDEYIKHVIRPA